MMPDDGLLQELATRVYSRYYGKYRGIVTDLDAARMRIKARVPAILDDAEVWCEPCVPFAGDGFGFCFLPENGSLVWIEFEGGDPRYPIWTGALWGVGAVPSDVANRVRVIVTAAGHKLIFDDAAGEIRVEDSNGATIVLDSSGITAKRDASSVAVGPSSVSINDGAVEVT